MRAARFGAFLTRQRVPAAAMHIRAPRTEAALLLAFAACYVGLSCVAGLVIRAWPRPLVDGAYFTADAWYVFGFKIGVLLALPLLWMRWRGYRVRDLSPGWRATPRTIAIAVASFAAGAALNTQHFRAIGEAASRTGALELIVLVVAGLAMPLLSAALPEELVYRGLLQSRLERVWGRLAAILLTAVLFAAWHIPSRYVLASGVEGQAGDLASVVVGTGVPVFVVGLVFGVLYDRHRQLVPLIAAHWGVDAVIGVAVMVGAPV